MKIKWNKHFGRFSWTILKKNPQKFHFSVFSQEKWKYVVSGLRVPPACSPNRSSEKTWPRRQEPTGVWRMKHCACKNTHPWIRQWAKKQNAGNDTLCNSSYLQFRRVRADVEKQTPEQAVAGRVSRSKHFLGPWQCSGSPGSTGYNIYNTNLHNSFATHPVYLFPFTRTCLRCFCYSQAKAKQKAPPPGMALLKSCPARVLEGSHRSEATGDSQWPYKAVGVWLTFWENENNKGNLSFSALLGDIRCPKSPMFTLLNRWGDRVWGSCKIKIRENRSDYLTQKKNDCRSWSPEGMRWYPAHLSYRSSTVPALPHLRASVTIFWLPHKETFHVLWEKFYP